jgi:hypothetical protein
VVFTRSNGRKSVRLASLNVGGIEVPSYLAPNHGIVRHEDSGPGVC